jgi:hypothetical protein
MSDLKWYHIVIGVLLAIVFSIVSAGAFLGVILSAVVAWASFKGIARLIAWAGSEKPSPSSSLPDTATKGPESQGRPKG